jgi:hypothetical protein
MGGHGRHGEEEEQVLIIMNAREDEAISLKCDG